MSVPPWNPLPAIGGFLARFVAGRVLGLAATLFLLPIVVAAARATGGWVHLVLGLCVFSVTAALAQLAGAVFAARGRAAAAPLALTAKFWFVLPLIALWPLLTLAGVADADKQPMLTGVATGLVVVLLLWLAWAALGRRRPAWKYQPANLTGWPWYLRVTMNAGGLLGGLLALGLMHS